MFFAVAEDPSQMTSGSRTSAANLFGANYPKLQELKRKYDPDNLFDRGTKLVSKPAPHTERRSGR